MLDYDEVLNEVGEFGRWQIWLFALLWIPSAVSAMQVIERGCFLREDIRVIAVPSISGFHVRLHRLLARDEVHRFSVRKSLRPGHFRRELQ